jgi:hypothetical protein
MLLNADNVVMTNRKRRLRNAHVPSRPLGAGLADQSL